MNFFQIILLNVVLLVFPLLIYLVYLSTNKNIEFKVKRLYFLLTLITSLFFIIEYSSVTILMSFLFLNTLIMLLYIENDVFFSILFSGLLIILYVNDLNNIFLLILMYIIIFLIYLVKRKYKMNQYIFIALVSIINILFVYKFNNSYFNIKETLLISISYIFIVNITISIYETTKKILNINSTLKELEQEKQIRLSLFKITHEIKNPIAVCKCYLDMLNTHDTKQVERYVPILKSEIDRLLSLLQDFLLINKNNLDLDIMDINMLVEDTIDKLNPLLEDSNIKLSLDLVDDEIYINGDYNRLSQVLINIIKNSIESIDNNGKITIESKQKKNEYVLIIRDNGCGMDSEVLKKIKEPFFTTKQRGSGLGVSLIHEIIEAHGAKINYSSKENEGTEVKLIFSMY